MVRQEKWSYSTWFGKRSISYADRNLKNNNVKQHLMSKYINAGSFQWLQDIYWPWIFFLCLWIDFVYGLLPPVSLCLAHFWSLFHFNRIKTFNLLLWFLICLLPFLKPRSGNQKNLNILALFIKMIKNHSKHFRSTGAFFNNSTIILKLIWPEKTNLLYFEISYFQKQNNFFPNNVGRHARCIQPRWQNSLYRLSMKIRGYPWATRVDTDSFVSEFLHETQLQSSSIKKSDFLYKNGTGDLTHSFCFMIFMHCGLGSNHHPPLLRKYNGHAHFDRTSRQNA